MPDGQIQATREKLLDGVVAGLVATLMMTALLVAAPALAGGRTAETLRSAGGLVGHPWVALCLLAAHFAYGALAGGLFTVGAQRVTVGRGAFFGFALWGLAAAVYAPLVGLGFLASHAPALAVIALPLHLAYGIALGALAPRGEIVQPIDAVV